MCDHVAHASVYEMWPNEIIRKPFSTKFISCQAMAAATSGPVEATAKQQAELTFSGRAALWAPATAAPKHPPPELAVAPISMGAGRPMRCISRSPGLNRRSKRAGHHQIRRRRGVQHLLVIPAHDVSLLPFMNQNQAGAHRPNGYTTHFTSLSMGLASPD